MMKLQELGFCLNTGSQWIFLTFPILHPRYPIVAVVAVLSLGVDPATKMTKLLTHCYRVLAAPKFLE